MPVPSEMKKAVRFICAKGLKLSSILGYDRPRFSPAPWGLALLLIQGQGHNLAATCRRSVQPPENLREGCQLEPRRAEVQQASREF